MKKGRAFALAATGLASLLICLTAIAASPASERNAATSADPALKRFIIQLQDPPLALYDGRELSTAEHGGVERLPATALHVTGDIRLDRGSPRALAYLEFLGERHREFRLEAAAILGRAVTPVYAYRSATNGMTLDLTEAEAALLADSTLVESIAPDTRHRLQTDSGPPWIGADQVWNGLSGFPSARGEGVIVGVIDSGINWEHPSFGSPSGDGYVYSNPFNEPLGLCDDPEVQCNDKLVGVYDFVEDDPETTDVVEENTKGRDNDGHGSHVASIAVGNRVNVVLNGSADATLSGVAPRATLITYRVCYIGEPAGPDTSGCDGSAILSAIDQAVDDGVDVLNYSIGSSASNPWSVGSISRAFLAARGAGIFVVTSAGNAGPNPGTMGSPANAPWIVAAGNASHDRVFGSVVQNLVGGATTPPDDLIGASLSGGVGHRQIVHAKDYGFALCGTGGRTGGHLQRQHRRQQSLGRPDALQRPDRGLRSRNLRPRREGQERAAGRRRRLHPGQHRQRRRVGGRRRALPADQPYRQDGRRCAARLARQRQRPRRLDQRLRAGLQGQLRRPAERVQFARSGVAAR